MLWIVLFFIIILISAILAFRSMKDYEEFPENQSLNALFFVANTQNFTEETVGKLHEVFFDRKQFFSLERLNKGKERALVIFGPRDIPEILPDLNLIEIEDYLADPNTLGYSDIEKKVGVNQTLTWLIEPPVNDKKPLHVGMEIKNLVLGDNQKFFIQLVCIPEEKRADSSFQSTLRIMVVDEDPIERVVLAKDLKQVWKTSTGLNIHEDNFPEQKKFESFKQRSLIPKEVTRFSLSKSDITTLIS